MRLHRKMSGLPGPFASGIGNLALGAGEAS